MKNLYADEQSKSFESIFADPKALYRETPFWAWNCELKPDQLKRQILNFKKMGMGGFHMHARTGLGTPYLSPEFMARVRECVETAKSEEMLAWLYDEDRWPSGAAGGLVTKEPEFRARYLLLTSEKRTEAPDAANDDSGKLLACYSIRLDADGALDSYKRIGAAEPAEEGAEKFYAYRMVETSDPWFNDQAYVDTLNPAAIRKFVDVTYEAYFKSVGDEFNKTIPAIFTDEPQFTRKTVLKFAREKRDVRMPFTDDLPETYRAAYDADFFETFPEVIWELPGGKYSLARYRYHDHVAERFSSAFADTIGGWCEEHGIRFSGHMMEEPTLESQTHALGEAMRSYRSFQLPGIDMLCDWMEFTTAKQAASASHQYGRGGVLSELDGVTDWDFNFMGHKGHGDWQAALGVTVRVPHLAWVSMAGEAKRDYPASISYQSPWHDKYRLIADHFARVNAAMTRGRARVRVGVIHPIESFWLVYGPQDRTASRREQAEEAFENTVSWLLRGLVDFDFISESLLPGQSPVQLGKSFIVGEMGYDVVVVPPTVTLRGSTLDRLEKFRAAGGRVIFAGDVATLCDAQESERPAQVARKCEAIPFTRTALLGALESVRELEVVKKADGYPLATLVSQMRNDGPYRYLFLANTERLGEGHETLVKVRGGFQVEYLDTQTGAITPVEARHENGWTVFDFCFYPHGHLLVRLTAAEESRGGKIAQPLLGDRAVEAATVGRLSGTMPVSLDEPNVLVLDMPKWRLEGDAGWQGPEEILRLDNQVRERLGLRERGGHIVQPWVYGKDYRKLATLELSYRFDSLVKVENPLFAMEEPERAELFLDGRPVEFEECGWWTDESLRTTMLPAIEPGEHELLVKIAYSNSGNVEKCFLLGDFGVELRGDSARLTAPVRELYWGDATRQGLPFYGGNITYHCRFNLKEAQELDLRLPSRVTNTPTGMTCPNAAREVPFAAYRGTLVSAALDGKPAGDLAFAPFQCALGKVEAGEHRLDLTLYGSRVNSAGALHLAFRMNWMGPGAWRTEGDMFSYEYQVQPFGIITAPKLLKH